MKKKIIKKNLYLFPPPADKCQFCAVKHDSEEPHNLESLCYQVGFHLKHKRFPCWSDAIAHCAPETKKLWKQELVKRGVWSEPDIKKNKCHRCGSELERRAGACYICSVCGESEGCG